jgi:nucleotide-binding universal stress UspA family protein
MRKANHSIEKVILAIDEESYGHAVAKFAVHHVWTVPPKFYLLHVVEPLTNIAMAPVAFDEANRVAESECGAGTALLVRIEKEMRTVLPGANIERLVPVGIPKDEILQLAVNTEANWIILGSHGRTGIKRFLLGSVSLSVVSHAPCSVVIVRLSQQDELEIENKRLDLSEDDLPQSMGSYWPTDVHPTDIRPFR